MNKTKFKILIVTLIILMVTVQVSAAKGKPVPPEPEEAFGNNLSVPVVFAEGIGLFGNYFEIASGLRSDEESLTVPFSLDDETYYLQQSENTWCADYRGGQSGQKEEVRLDWADNLVRQTWSTNSIIRVENVMFLDLPIPTMQGYDMYFLGGEGKDEIWGTKGNKADSDIATVFSATARLKIEKLTGEDQDGDPGEPVAGLAPLFDSAIYEGFGLDGKLEDKYSAEINVGGKAIYGYNWDLAKYDGLPSDQKEGWYRLTFSIDAEGTYTLTQEGGAPETFNITGNVHFSALDEPDQGDLALYKPALKEDGLSSVLEIYIKSAKGGGKK